MAIIKISDYKPIPPVMKITIGKNSVTYNSNTLTSIHYGYSKEIKSFCN